MSDNRWLTVKEVAPLLGIGTKLVYVMSSADFPEARRIPCYRLGARGGKLRFKREEIDAYIRNLRLRPEVVPPQPFTSHRPRKVERRRPHP